MNVKNRTQQCVVSLVQMCRIEVLCVLQYPGVSVADYPLHQPGAQAQGPIDHSNALGIVSESDRRYKLVRRSVSSRRVS